jgi:hypothetical protein
VVSLLRDAFGLQVSLNGEPESGKHDRLGMPKGGGGVRGDQPRGFVALSRGMKLDKDDAGGTDLACQGE